MKDLESILQNFGPGLSLIFNESIDKKFEKLIKLQRKHIDQLYAIRNKLRFYKGWLARPTIQISDSERKEDIKKLPYLRVFVYRIPIHKRYFVPDDVSTESWGTGGLRYVRPSLHGRAKENGAVTFVEPKYGCKDRLVAFPTTSKDGKISLGPDLRADGSCLLVDGVVEAQLHGELTEYLQRKYGTVPEGAYL